MPKYADGTDLSVKIYTHANGWNSEHGWAIATPNFKTEPKPTAAELHLAMLDAEPTVIVEVPIHAAAEDGWNIYRPVYGGTEVVARRCWWVITESVTDPKTTTRDLYSLGVSNQVHHLMHEIHKQDYLGFTYYGEVM